MQVKREIKEIKAIFCFINNLFPFYLPYTDNLVYLRNIVKKGDLTKSKNTARIVNNRFFTLPKPDTKK